MRPDLTLRVALPGEQERAVVLEVKPGLLYRLRCRSEMLLEEPMRMAIISDPGERTSPRERVFQRGNMLALLRGYTNSNAAGVGPFGLALDHLERELGQLPSSGVGEEHLEAALERSHAAIFALNRSEQCRYHSVSASVKLLYWASNNSPTELLIGSAGGESVLLRRQQETSYLSPADTLLRESGIQEHELPPSSREMYASICIRGLTGQPPEEARKYAPIISRTQLQKGDMLFVFSAGTVEVEHELAGIVTECCQQAESVAQLARCLKERLERMPEPGGAKLRRRGYSLAVLHHDWND